MKFINLMFIAVTTASLYSCTEKATYNLDSEKSELNWKGSVSPEYFHTGSVKISEGKIEMEDDKVMSGTFKIDMKSIKVEDAALPEDKKEKLAMHLGAEDFFNTAKFANVDVKVTGYENGKLATTITVMGKEIKQDIPVKMKKDEKNITFSGKFDIDFESLKLEGMQPDPETGDRVQPKVSYEMTLVLNK